MKILLAAIHYPVASGRYIARAFQRLGHDVKTVGPSTGNQIWGIEVDQRYVWGPDVIEEGWEPDLTITADSAFTIEDDHRPHVIWGVDNHVRDYALGAHFDHYFLAHHDGPALPVDESREDMTWLPCAYDPEFHTPSPIPMEHREYDVAIVSVPYPRRQEIVAALKAAGLKVFAGMGQLYEDYAAIYHNARISLCVSFNGDVAQRVFECSAMGCAIVSDVCADFDRLGFKAFADYSPFSTIAEAVVACKSLIAVPEYLDFLADRALSWAKPHTWDARAKTLLEAMAVKA